ncbi:secG [Symbiodinium sp. CCMP2456]|nr:secG [Symbiodinium sp. CCMP2456]
MYSDSAPEAGSQFGQVAGATALWQASFSGISPIVSLLLEHNALYDLEATAPWQDKPEHGLTPLHVAARMGHAAVVEVLIEAGAEYVPSPASVEFQPRDFGRFWAGIRELRASLSGLALALGLARVGLAALGPGSCAFLAINGQGLDSFRLVLLEPMSAGENQFRMVDGSGTWVGASSSIDLTYPAGSCQWLPEYRVRPLAMLSHGPVEVNNSRTGVTR